MDTGGACAAGITPQKHTSFPHTAYRKGNGILTFILVLPIKAMAAMILFPVFCQNVSASSSMLGLKVVFWPRKQNYRTTEAVYSSPFSLGDLAGCWVNWRRSEGDGKSWAIRAAGMEKWVLRHPSLPHLVRVVGFTPDPDQFLSKLAYLERLALFELQTFPQFSQSLCFWSPESVSTAGQDEIQPSLATGEFHEDLHRERKIISTVIFLLSCKRSYFFGEK